MLLNLLCFNAFFSSAFEATGPTDPYGGLIIIDWNTTKIYMPIRHVVCAGALGQVKTILRVMQLKLHKPTMAIDYSLRRYARHVDSTNPGRSNLVFRSKPIPEAEMSNRLIY